MSHPMIAYDEFMRTTDPKGWEFKYYKGLGTSTSKEAKAYFSDLPKHKIDFVYDDADGEEVTDEDGKKVRR